jgi:hypothetical protein
MTVKIHDWSEVRGNVFRRKPTPKMLLPEGDVIRGSFMLSGDSTYSVREEKFVKYDVNYIEAKLAFKAPKTLLGIETAQKMNVTQDIANFQSTQNPFRD